MGRPSQKIYNSGGVCGEHQCPCGKIFSGKDERTRQKLKNLHKKYCQLGAQTTITTNINIPDHFNIGRTVIDRYKEQIKRNNGQGTAAYDVRGDY
jgi:hypothetical protein